MASPAQSIRELVEPLAFAAGLELWDVEVNPRTVRVLVDRPGGIDLGSLTDLTRVVSAALDGHDELSPGAQYQLEVSSPGVERMLRTPSHFQRYVGTEVAVKTTSPVDGHPSGTRRLQGVLLAADATGITIGLDEGPRELGYDQIQKAHSVLVWGPQPKNRSAKSKDSARSKSPKAELTKDAAR